MKKYFYLFVLILSFFTVTAHAAYELRFPTGMTVGSEGDDEGDSPLSLTLIYDTSISQTAYIPVSGSVNIAIDWGDDVANESCPTTFSASTLDCIGLTPFDAEYEYCSIDAEANINQHLVSCTYDNAALKTVKVTGHLDRLGTDAPPTNENQDVLYSMSNLVAINSWGNLGLKSAGYAFIDASSLIHIPSPLPSSFTSVVGLLAGETGLNDSGTFSLLDLGLERFSDWSALFAYTGNNFTSSLPLLDTSNVTRMKAIFAFSSINSDLSSWSVGRVEDLSYAFYQTPFNQNISNWNTGNVSSFSYTFAESLFNGDISTWDVSSGTYFIGTFMLGQFNQDIGTWDMSSAQSINSMFYMNYYFNQYIGDWDVSGIKNFQGTFYKASSYNQSMAKWDISKATNISSMLDGASSFNHNLSCWYVVNFPYNPNFSKNSGMQASSVPIWGTNGSGGTCN